MDDSSTTVQYSFTQSWPSHSVGDIPIANMDIAHVRNALHLVYSRFQELLKDNGIEEKLPESDVDELDDQQARRTLHDLREAQVTGQQNKGPITFQRDNLNAKAPELAATRESLIQAMVQETIFRPRFQP